MADPIGITPDEGETYIAEKIYVNSQLKIGLWVGTWNNIETVEYADATAEFTKLLSLSGLEEQILANWTIGQSGATHPKISFTAGSGVTNQEINGWYIASLDNRLVHVQRRETPSFRSSGQTFTVNADTEVA